MMMQDPYQSYAYQTNPGWGAYAGAGIPFGLPQTGLQGSMLNPTTGFNPQTPGFSPFAQQGYPGITGFGQIHPQQFQQGIQGVPQIGASQNPIATLLQNPLLLAQLQNPFTQFQNPLTQLQNPLTQLQNPLAQLQNPLAQLQNPLAQLQNPLAQLQNPLLQNPHLNPILALSGLGGGSPFGWHQHSPYQQQSPYQQFGQFGGYGQLLPQTWLGQPGAYGSNPFARGFQQQGISPWACF